MSFNWSYLSGLIDGEGTITINRTGKGSYECRAKIGNTDLRLMKWLISKFGGVYYTETNRNPLKHRTLYQWRIKGRKNTEDLLLGILPHLVLKAEQAKIALTYLRAETTEEREKCFLAIQPLNKRGVSVTTNTLESSQEDMIESDLMSDHESVPDVNQGSDICKIPPEGWWCSRESGHDGPCAARQI
jgi:hypothetical protein